MQAHEKRLADRAALSELPDETVTLTAAECYAAARALRAYAHTDRNPLTPEESYETAARLEERITP